MVKIVGEIKQKQCWDGYKTADFQMECGHIVSHRFDFVMHPETVDEFVDKLNFFTPNVLIAQMRIVWLRYDQMMSMLTHMVCSG